MRAIEIRVLLVGLCLLASALFVTAQDPTPEAPPTTPGQQRPGGFGQASQDPQPYEKVITKDAKSKKGVFTVHQVKDKF